MVVRWHTTLTSAVSKGNPACQGDVQVVCRDPRPWSLMRGEWGATATMQIQFVPLWLVPHALPSVWRRQLGAGSGGAFSRTPAGSEATPWRHIRH